MGANILVHDGIDVSSDGPSRSIDASAHLRTDHDIGGIPIRFAAAIGIGGGFEFLNQDLERTPKIPVHIFQLILLSVVAEHLSSRLVGVKRPDVSTFDESAA